MNNVIKLQLVKKPVDTLTVDQVKQIREMLVKKYSYSHIANRFNTEEGHVAFIDYNLRNGITKYD